MRFVFRAVFEVLGLAIIATGYESQGTNFRFDGKVPLKKRSMKDVPSKISTANSGAIPNQALLLKLALHRFRKINLFKDNSCLTLRQCFRERYLISTN